MQINPKQLKELIRAAVAMKKESVNVYGFLFHSPDGRLNSPYARKYRCIKCCKMKKC
jgi:hypothetical protein